MAWALDRPRGLRWHGRETVTGEGLRAVAVSPGAHFTGLLIALVAAWGALSVFVGPLFGWTPTTSGSWAWSTQNWMLHLIPGAVAFVAGLMILMASPRRLAGRGILDLAALATIASGAWFVIGPALWSTFESGAPYQAASPMNEFWNQLGSSLGPGLLLTFLGGMALKAGISRAGVAVAEPAAEAAPMAAREPMAAGREPMGARREPMAADREAGTETMADREGMTGREGMEPAVDRRHSSRSWWRRSRRPSASSSPGQ